jgi:hypothetical protein
MEPIDEIDLIVDRKRNFYRLDTTIEVISPAILFVIRLDSDSDKTVGDCG